MLLLPCMHIKWTEEVFPWDSSFIRYFCRTHLPNRKSLSHIFRWLVTFYNNCFCCAYFSVSGCCFCRGIMNAAVNSSMGKFQSQNTSDFFSLINNYNCSSILASILKWIVLLLNLLPFFLHSSFLPHFSSSLHIYKLCLSSCWTRVRLKHTVWAWSKATMWNEFIQIPVKWFFFFYNFVISFILILLHMEIFGACVLEALHFFPIQMASWFFSRYRNNSLTYGNNRFLMNDWNGIFEHAIHY